MSDAIDTPPAYDVIVIGSGLTGLSALWHLRRQGISRIALSAGPPGSPSDAGAQQEAAGFCSGGLPDNFTRLSHTLGPPLAADLWHFGDRAFDALLAFATQAQVPHVRGGRQRLITSEGERTEARQAVQELKAAGLIATLDERPDRDRLTERVLAVQDEGTRGAFVDPPALIAALQRQTEAVPRLAATQRIETPGPHLRLHLADQSTASTELAIVAAHLGTKSLLPEIAEALVSVADQWSEVSLAPGVASDLEAWEPGLCFSANHTYEWGVVLDRHRLRLGGGRYLRPMAGIEAPRASADPKITAHLLQQLGRTFALVPSTGVQVRATQAFLDIRPCDELPVIGPMYGQGRLLVATGYGGAGLTMGFYAGQLLAELVATGQADGLPRRLWPERLRSLGDGP